jgi:hypothetical protein
MDGNMAEKYIPIKKEIIYESNLIFKKLLKNSANVLGIILRGTDYLSIKPKDHPIPPSSEIVIKDIKLYDNKNKYDMFFLATEDDLIREKFINEFKTKLKYLIPNTKINYNYTTKLHIAFTKNMKGNINNMKSYLINIIIVSKCIDMISSKCYGAVGALALTKGFRYKKIYDLGVYK